MFETRARPWADPQSTRWQLYEAVCGLSIEPAPPPGAERATLYWTVVSGPLFVSVNGRRVEIGGSCSVRHLLERCHAGDGPCAVEVNEELVPRSEHEHRRLQGGDRIEIVTLVGGG